jgi:tetratricopeptide (TPR) repeat protein
MRLARLGGDQRAQALLRSGLAALRGVRGEYRLQVELLEQALEIGRHCDDFALEASLYQRLGWAYGLVGDNRMALEWTERGIAFCERDPGRAGHVSGFGTYSWLLAQRAFSLLYMSRFEDAEHEARRASAIAEEQRDPLTLVYALSGQAELAWLRGDLEAMARHAEAEADIARRRDWHMPVAEMDGMIADVERGYFDAAIAKGERALSEWCEMQGVVLLWGTTYVLLALAAAHAATGRRDLATSSLREAESNLARYPELRSSSPRIHLLLVRALRAIHGASARARIDDALSVAEAGGERGWRALVPFADYERARLAALCNDDQERRRSLEAAGKLFAETGCGGRAERIGAELSEL